MSWWILPTTADIGLRAFSDDAAGAMKEAALGMQEIQMATGTSNSDSPRTESSWIIDTVTDDYGRVLVRWLEEVLYRAQGEGKWLCEATINILDNRIDVIATWVDADLVQRELEIKAVTMHEVALVEVGLGEVIAGVDSDIPSFEGPGWMAQVVFDI